LLRLLLPLNDRV